MNEEKSTDRQLLELAAKTAEEDPWFDENDNAIGWNPLEDDGDALRLAVKLNILHHKIGSFIRTDYHHPYPWEHPAFEVKEFIVNGDDLAATRRAIVRVAAAYGKAM